MTAVWQHKDYLDIRDTRTQLSRFTYVIRIIVEILKVNISYKYFFEKPSPVIFRNSRHFLNFYHMKCFWLVARRQPKVTKIQNVAGISNYYRTKLLKKVLIKNVHL